LRVTYVGELGYEIYLPTEFAVHVYESLWEAGQDLGIKNAGYRSIASLHLEKGYVDWGSELTPEYTPFDAGLGFCVALDKDNFIGCEALAKVKAEGPRWKLCSFTIDTGSPLMLQSSAPIIQGGKVLGVTTSSGYGHTLKKNICYAYIPAEQADPNKDFEIESYKERYTATLESNRILYDPERKKILM
jgi:4-methylaminobutanoate oxidase (formaldehyde-forming)